MKINALFDEMQIYSMNYIDEWLNGKYHR